MSDARAKAEELADWMYDHHDSKWEALAVHVEGALDAYAAERTAALRAALQGFGNAFDLWVKVRKGLHRAGMEPTPTEMDLWSAWSEVNALLADPKGQRP